MVAAAVVLPAPARPTIRARSSRGVAGGGELAGGGEEPRLVAEVVGRGVVGHAVRVLADRNGLGAVERQPGERPAIGLVEGGALDVGFGERRAGRGHPGDEPGALGGRRAGQGRDLAGAFLALDLRRLRVTLSVLAEGLAEPVWPPLLPVAAPVHASSAALAIVLAPFFGFTNLDQVGPGTGSRLRNPACSKCRSLVKAWEMP